MPAPVIQADYDSLGDIAKYFVQEAGQTQQLIQQVGGCVNALVSGGWIGVGAEAFYNEMDELVFPGLNRLSSALEDAGSATQRIAEALRQHEEEAARLFQGDGSAGSAGGTPSGSVGGGTGSGSGEGSTRPGVQPTKDGPVPLYMMRLDDPNFNPDAFVRNLDTNGRPVIFMVHGFNEPHPQGAYENAADWYSQQYGHLPESQRPIIVGVEWDSSKIDLGKAAGFAGVGGYLGGIPGAVAGGVGSAYGDYTAGNNNAIETGQRFGRVLEQFNYFHPESSVNVIAHSLGNRMFMEAVASSNVHVDNYLAVQAAVDQNQISANGRFADVLGSEIRNMGATYTPNDVALHIHEFFGYGDAFGHSANTLGGRPLTTYNMQPTDSTATLGWGPFSTTIPTGINHYSYDTPEIRNVVMDFFGADGSGFQRR